MALLMLLPSFAFGESAMFGKGTVYVREKGGTLHLRSGQGTDTESLGFVHHGDEVDVLMLGGEWSYIFSYREFKSGYIKTKYIVDFTPAENMYSEETLTLITDSSELYPIPGKYHLDLDSDGITDTVYANLFYDEYEMENFTITFETAYGSSGEATIPFSAYDASIAFAKLDDTGRVYVFITGDVASTDFETYGFYVEEGHMKNVDFVPPMPFRGPLGVYGALRRIDEGTIVICPTLDVLGTRFYNTDMRMENGKIVPVKDGYYTTVYDLVDLELWEYASLKAVSNIPCVIEGNETSLSAGAKVLVNWLDVSEKKVGFVTENGENGYFVYSEALDHDWGVYVGGIYESDAFEDILYAG